MINVDEEWARGPRGFRILGNQEQGYFVKACGNHRVLSDYDIPLKTLEEARNWLTYFYPGAKLVDTQ
jgi:hypothetical protein